MTATAGMAGILLPSGERVAPLSVQATAPSLRVGTLEIIPVAAPLASQ